MMAHKPKRLSRYVGTVIGIAGLAFAAYAVYLAREEVSVSDVDIRIFVVAVGVGICAMLIVGLNWLRIITSLGHRSPIVEGLRWYYVGQLGKYIPGGLWAVLGRSELATRGGLPRTVAYPSVAMSLVTTYASAAATGAAFLAVGGTTTSTKLLWATGSVVIVAATIVGLSSAVVGRVNRLLDRFGLSSTLPACPPTVSGVAVIATVPTWLLVGFATALCARSLGIDADVAAIIAATSYSWLAGFLVIPLPGGLGVREAVFIALWPGSAPEAAAIAVLARLAFILADLIGAGSSTLVAHVMRTMRSTAT